MSDVLFWSIALAYVLVLAGMACALVRLVRGPSLADRVVALDAITVSMVAFAGLLALETGKAAFLDVGIGLALVAFLGTVAFARYAERRPPEPPPGEGS